MGVFKAENWSLKQLHSWKQRLKTDLSLQQRQGTLSLMKDQTHVVLTYPFVLESNDMHTIQVLIELTELH